MHRDIKPENIMLARDGTARIVDFGLARSDPRAPGTATVAGQAATVTASLDGGLSGTPAYMSPEQARGTAGDFRTDQFSFGALLYEMATGKHAFRRDTMADTLAAVLHDEPRPIAEQNSRIPPSVRWIIERCLAKDAGERYSATDDLARELRWVRDHLSEALAEPKPAAEASRGVRGWKLIAAALVAAVAGGIAVIGVMSSEPEAAPVRFVPFASASSYEGEPSWSPDGQSLAYTADVDGVLQVFVKRVGDALSRPVTSGQFDASHPFWTRNGERVYYISQAGEHEALWSVGVAGGRPELELENVSRAAIDSDGHAPRALAHRSGCGDAPDVVVVVAAWLAVHSASNAPPFDRLRTGGDGLSPLQRRWPAAGLDVRHRHHQHRRTGASHRVLPRASRTGAGAAGPDRRCRGTSNVPLVRLVARQPPGRGRVARCDRRQPAFMDRRHRFRHRAPDHGRPHQRNRALGGAGRCANRVRLGRSGLRSRR